MAAEVSEPDADERGPTVQVVEFTVAGERFAVDVHDVDSMEGLTELTRVPRTSDAIDGVMDLRGEITAVIDPRVHLDVDETASEDEQQVLVLDQTADKQKLGLRVDSVDGVEEYPESSVVDVEEFDELDSAGVRDRAIGAIVKAPSPDSEFDPVGVIDVVEIIDRSRRGR
ncbi:MAG: chemotaxis protein CheW [Halobacteriales archaeon]